jgi:hypothetical protein
MRTLVGARAGRVLAARALAMTAALLAAGCAADEQAASGPSTAPPGTAIDASGGSSTTSSTSSVVPFAGPGDFYDVPDPLPAGEPGALIRYQQVDTTAADRTLWRVMYHSRDAQDRDVAVTGLVSVPTAPAPPGGWPTLSWGHGTSGMAPACAPSRSAHDVPAFGTDGIVAASDYNGLGPNGQRHAYLSGVSEGRSVIDAVRAARSLPDVTASDEWTTVGISQGGHAVLFASEQADDYAPELTLLGTVAMAPGTELDRTFPGDTPQVVSVIKAMAVYGLAVDHPEIRPEEYATPALQEASARFDVDCLNEVSAALLTIPADGYWTVDPLTTDVGRRVAAANNPGVEPSAAPLLVVQGDADVVVVPARTQAFLDRVCSNGWDVQLEVVPGADHDLRNDQARADIAAWLDARLAHEPTSSTC